MEASRGGDEKATGKEMTPLEYLVMWIGAIGQFVGLEVPIEVAKAVAGANSKLQDSLGQDNP